MADPEKLKGYVAFVRELTIVVVLVLLLGFPRVINDRLEQAGFVKASIAGFEWESLQDSLKRTQEATDNAARLEQQLLGLNSQLAEIRQAPSTPPQVRERILPLIRDVEQTRTATSSVKGDLQNSLVLQRSVIERLKPRIPERR